MPPSTSRTQGKRPGDLTGVRGQQLSAAAAQAKAAQGRETAAVLEAERQIKINTDVDYSTPHQVIPRVIDGGEGELVMEEIEIVPTTRRIRVNYPVDDMTFGREILQHAKYSPDGKLLEAPVVGNLRTYKFELGVWYTVDEDLAAHLTYLGYLHD
jgi:hypothetical protein